MNELSLEEHETLYSEFVEAERQELRKEGAEELRAAIMREIDHYIARAWTSQEKSGLQTARQITVVASI